MPSNWSEFIIPLFLVVAEVPLGIVGGAFDLVTCGSGGTTSPVGPRKGVGVVVGVEGGAL